MREDKTHSTGLKLSDPDILVPNEPWCHSSPAMDRVEGKTQFFFGQIEDNVWKINLIWIFFVKFFLDHSCSLNTNDITPMLYTCLTFYWSFFLLYCWLFDDSALVLGPEKEKKKTASSWFHGMLNFSEKSNF